MASKVYLELSEVIEGLRNEMEKAQDLGANKNIRFDVPSIEIELDVSIAKKMSGEMKVAVEGENDKSLLKYLVGKVTGKVELTGGGEYQTISTQKIKLVLSPRNADGTGVNFAGER